MLKEVELVRKEKGKSPVGRGSSKYKNLVWRELNGGEAPRGGQCGCWRDDGRERELGLGQVGRISPWRVL